jgi:hypothetical protein
MYSDSKIGKSLIRRVISESKASNETTWHRDRRDRVVLVVEGAGWKFQRDNAIPQTIKRGDILTVGANEWHRVIPGQGDLVVVIKEGTDKPEKLLVDLIGEEDNTLDLDGTEPVEDYQEMSIEDEEHAMLVSEDDLLEAVLILREAKKKADHKGGYKAPEGSARDRKLDAAKAAYKRGDVSAAIRIRDEMEKQARNKPGFKAHKSKYTDETKQPAEYPPVMSEDDALEALDEDQMFEGLSTKTREALKKKAENSNAPLGALTTVYRKGLGAFYSSGSRPGMTSHQWAMARVNSFLKGGKARKVDAAQWKQVQQHRKK